MFAANTVHFRLDFFMEANSMNSDLVLYCLQYRLPKNISRLEEQMTKGQGLIIIGPYQIEY